MLNWKTIHYLSYLALIFFALEPSYIHPDEHFQSLEILQSYHSNIQTTISWEFHHDTPSRSFAILSLFYSPLIWCNNKFLGLEPLGLMYLIRISLLMGYFITVQYSMRILNDGKKQEYTKALFFIFTSYITWCYQSRTFSNSIETILLLVSLSLIYLICKDGTFKTTCILSSLLGGVLAIGCFNRITFAGFLLLPGVKLLRYYSQRPRTSSLAILSLILTFSLISYAFILIDTSYFKSSSFVIAPLNNLFYNIQTENLSQHGLHPRYTHILINLPQIIGPMIIPIIFRNHYKTSISYLSLISGLLTLSIFPHQELRFLVPLMPLLCNVIDFRNVESQKYVNWLISLWVVFNVIMAVIMGSLHQRGVIVALDYLRDSGFEETQVWWKTYKPPTWILNSDELQIQECSQLSLPCLVDLMGASPASLLSTLKQQTNGKKTTYLITPRSSAPLLETMASEVTLNKVWSYDYHLDMDHFDFNDIRTFYPGIDIYDVQLF